MTVRFFILQAHYRGTLDFSNEALQASEKALKRVLQAYKDLVGEPAEPLPYGELSNATAPDNCVADSPEIKAIFDGVYDALCDDLNTPVALSHIFEAVRIINSAKSGSVKLTANDRAALAQIFDDIVFGVLGLRDEAAGESGKGQEVISGLMDMVLEERAKAKAARDDLVPLVDVRAPFLRHDRQLPGPSGPVAHLRRIHQTGIPLDRC